MDVDVLTLTDRLDLDPVARGLWEVLLPHVPAALHAEDGPLLTALSAAARSSALAGSVSVAALLDAYNEGCGQLRRLLAGEASAEAGEARRCLQALEKPALSQIAVGYCAGLEEALEALRRAAQELSPLDPATGALKPREFLTKLRVEAERCRRVDAPLGLLGLALPRGSVKTEHPLSARQDAAHRLRDGLRKYDSLGLTAQGDLAVLMPDVSRRGLVAVAERLCGEGKPRRGRAAGSDLVCTFFHYDEVDTEAAAMLAALEQSLDEARFARRLAAS